MMRRCSPVDSYVALTIALTAMGAAAVTAQASPRARRDSTTNGWYAGIASGWYFPIEKWPTSYVLGGGGTLLLGRQTGRLAVELQVNMWLLSGNARSTWDFKASPVITWEMGHSALTPYVVAGLGVDVQSNYPDRSTTLGAVLPLGGGLRFTMGPKREIFVESLYYVVFRSTTTRDIPLLGGFRVGL